MRFRSLAVFFLAASSCVATAPAQRREITGEFQPLEAGLEWIYDANGLMQVRRVRGVEKVGRFECHVIESRTGNIVEKFWLRSDRAGVRLFRAFDGIRTVEFDDPLVLIPPQPRPGATWTFQEHHGPMTLAVEGRYERDEDLPFEDGVLSCARFRLMKRAANRLVVDQTSWYARDVGLVRMRAFIADEAGESKSTLQLVSRNFISERTAPDESRRR